MRPGSSCSPVTAGESFAPANDIRKAFCRPSSAARASTASDEVRNNVLRGPRAMKRARSSVWPTLDSNLSGSASMARVNTAFERRDAAGAPARGESPVRGPRTTAEGFAPPNRDEGNGVPGDGSGTVRNNAASDADPTPANQNPTMRNLMASPLHHSRLRSAASANPIAVSGLAFRIGQGRVFNGRSIAPQ